jgi:hypothetical protein
MKARRSRYVFLNKIARSVIASCRGKHSDFLFSRQGKPVAKIYNSGWKAARKRASDRYARELGRSCPAGFQAIRVHDLKHTFGHRLRGAGVSFEDRVMLLGHRSTLHPTTHYSAAEVRSLIATEAVCRLQAKASPAIAVVRFETDHDHRLREGTFSRRLARKAGKQHRTRGATPRLPRCLSAALRKSGAALCKTSLGQGLAILHAWCAEYTRWRPSAAGSQTPRWRAINTPSVATMAFNPASGRSVALGVCPP